MTRLSDIPVCSALAGKAATASNVTIENENVAIENENVAIEVAMNQLNARQGTIAKAKAVFANMGVDGVFGRFRGRYYHKEFCYCRRESHYETEKCGFD